MRLRYSDVTPERLYWSRRDFMLAAAAAAAAGGIWAPAAEAAAPQGVPLAAQRNAPFSLAEAPTKFESATTYNNFYEFGVNKEDPARLAGTLRPRPWSVQVEGHAAKPRSFDIDELLKLAPLEERVYALRCVEGWSMVIPWIGVPLAALLKRVEPTSKARYVEFVTLVDPAQFPAQKPRSEERRVGKECRL